MTKFLLLLTSLYVTTFFSQTTNSSWIRYENYVDTLSSNYFKGRGYVDNGHLSNLGALYVIEQLNLRF